MLKDFANRLTSRKFLLTLAGAATAVNQHQYTAAAAIVVAYLGTEGVVDARAVTTASTIEGKAHDLATEFLQELSALQNETPAAAAPRPVKAAGSKR